MNTELSILERKTDLVALYSNGGISGLIEQLEQQTRSIVPDVSTAKGRKEIASIAAKVARSKTALDAAGKECKEHHWKICQGIDKDRKAIRDRLDNLKEEVRRPLTEWEGAEKARVDALQVRLDALKIEPDELATSAELAEQLATLESVAIDDSWEEKTAEAAMYKDAAITRFRRAIDVVIEREKAAAIAQRIAAKEAKKQRIAAEKAQQEREERIAKEAAENARKEAERIAAEAAAKAEADRLAAEQRAIEAEQREREMAEQAKIEAEQAEKRQAEAIRQAEERAKIEAQQQAAREKAEAEAMAKAQREAEEKRQADKEHQAQINRAIVGAVTRLGINESQAKMLIGAIARGKIPNVSIQY